MTATSAHARALRRLSSSAGRRWESAPLLFGALFLVVLIVQFGSLLDQAALHADNVSAFVIADSLGPASGRDVLLGNFAWYQQLWFSLATGWLPGHRVLWEAFPYGLALIAIALTAWAALAVAGRWAATVTGVLLLCAGAPLLTNLFQGTTHSPTSFHVALLGAVLVLMTRHGVRPWLVVLAGVISAAGVCDPLFYLAGLAPLVLAGGAAWLGAGRRDLVVGALAIAVIAVVLGALLNFIMESSGYRVAYFETTFAPYEKLWSNARIALQGFLLMNSGDFWGRPLGARGAFAALCAVLLVGAFVLAVRAVRASALGWRGLDATRLAYVAFWSSCGVLTLAAYIGTTVPYDVFTFRYIVPAWFAVAALLPLARPLAAWVAPVVTAGVCVLAVAATAALARGDATTPANNWPDHALQEQLEAALKPLGVTKGYAPYWDAAPITWASDMRLQVHPVSRCDQQSPKLCRHYFHSIGSWYVPGPERTFLIVDPANADQVPAPDPAFGEPLRRLTVGRLQVYVYGDDIGGEIGPG